MSQALDTTTLRHCPVCTQPAHFERSLHDVVLYRCSDCDHCFTDVSKLNVEEKYSAAYFEEKHRNWFAHPNYALFSAISEVVDRHAPRGAVLDVGCGRGDLLHYLQQRNPGLSLTGVDLSEMPARADIELIRGDFLTWDNPRQFDVVVSLATIEHVEDVHEFVRGMLRSLKPGGQLVVMTLNDRSVLYSVARWMGLVGFDLPLERLYDRHHLNHFSGESLKRLLTLHGLRLLGVKNHNAPMAAVDFEAGSPLGATVLRAGVWGTFALGRLTGRTFLQTAIARAPV